MSQTKPKWLLTAFILVAALSLSVVGYATPPPNPTIISPTTTAPVAVQQGNNVYVTFGYISQPTVAGTTRAEIEVRKGGTIIGTRQVAFPLLPDTDASGAVFTAAVPIDTPVAQGTYNIRLQMSNHDGASANINEPDAVLVDNAAPANVANFGPIISGAPEPILTWIEPGDFGAPASGIGWYEVSIYDGVNPPVFFYDVSAVDPDLLTPGFQWSVPGQLADGSYTISVWARDKAYNRSAAAGTGTLIIDTTKPVLDQQGPVGFVNNASPTLTARFRDLGLGVSGYKLFAAPPDAFELDGLGLSPDSQPGSGDATGLITKAVGPLAEGEHEVSLTLHDVAGNGASLTWSFFVDTVLPSAPGSVTAPDPTMSTTPAFSWAPGADNGAPQSGVAGYTVEIWTTGIGGALVRGPYTATDDANPGTAEFDWTLPDALTLDGDYEIRVWTVDNTGNSSASHATAAFRRDTTAPLLDMEEPPNTTWTSFTPPTIKVRFRDQGAGATGFGSVVTFTLDGNPYLTTTGLATGALGPGFIEADLTGVPLGDGPHAVSIVVSDVAGNTGSTTWLFAIDRTAPAPPSDFRVVGGTLDPTPPPTYWTNDPTPQFEWDPGTDGGSGVASYRVEIYLDSVLEHTYIGVVDEVPGGDVQRTIPDALADGIYEIRVYSVDNCGNESAYAGMTFGVDSSISTVMLDQESPKSFVSVGAPTLSVRFRDLAVPSSGYHSTLEFKVDKGLPGEVDLLTLLISQPSAGAQVGHITAISTLLSEGPHAADITVRDYAGNTASLNWSFFVDTQRPTAPGAISVTSPTADPTPAFSWIAANDPVPASGIASYTAEIHNGAGPVLGPYYGIPGMTWDLPYPLPADGLYTIKLWAVDNAGNVSATSTDATFRLDTTPPVLDNPSPIGATNNTTPTLSVRFTDAGGSGYDSTTAWTITPVGDITPPGGQPLAGDVTGYITKTSPALAEGSHTVTITVEDDAGNSATLSWSFTVDTTAPSPPTNVAAPDPTNDTTPTFTWDAAVDNVGGSGIASYIVEVWTTGVGPAKIRGPYAGITGTSFTLPQSGALSPDEKYEVRVWSVDNAANVSGSFGSDTFVLDTGKPVLSNGTPTGLQPKTGTLTMQFADDRTGLAGAYTSIAIADGIGNPGTVNTPYMQPADGTKAGQISAGYSVPTDGTWTVTASIRDLAGNVSDEFTWSFMVDDTPPTVTVIYPAEETITWDKWTEIHATIIDEAAPDGTSGSGVDWGSVYGVLQGEGMIGWPLYVADFNPGTGLAVLQMPFGFDGADGRYVAAVAAQDMAGNLGGDQREFLLQQTYAPGMEGLPQFTTAVPVTVTWTDVDNEEWYELQVDTDPGFGSPDGYLIGYDVTSFDVSIVSDGRYYFRVRAAAYGGRVSLWSNTVSTIVDTTPPGGPVLTLLTGSPTNKWPQAWSWTAPVGADGYVVSINGGAWENVGNVRAHETWFMTDGTYTFAVKACDLAGHESAQVEGSVVIDLTPPGVPTSLQLSEPVGLIIGPVLYTADGTPKVKWDAVTDVDIDHYVVEIDGQAWIEVLAPTVAYEFTKGLADGEHTVRVKAVDALGNAGAYCGPLVFTVDTTPPAVPGTPSTTSPTNSIWPMWTWELSPAAVAYNVYLDGAATPGVTVGQPSPGDDMFFVYPPNLAEGTHHLHVTALDALGNESAKSGTGHVVIDLTAPVVPELLPLAAYTNADEIMLIWTAVDSAVKYDVEYTIDGVVTTASNIGIQALNLDISSTGDGDVVTAKARAYDAVGNASGWSNTVTTIVDRTGPVVTLGPQPGSPTSNPRPTWTWSGADAVSEVDYYIVTLGSEPPFNTEGTSFTPESNLADGSHVLKVKAVDIVGNVGAQVAFGAVVIDTTPPAVPGMPRTASPTNNRNPVWTWGAVAGAARYRVFEDEVDKGFVTAPTYTSSMLTEGTHYLQVTALDALDNESARSEAGYVVIDLTPPAVPAMKALPPFTKDATLVFEWSTSDTAVKYELSYSKNGGTSWTEVPNLTAQSYTLNISDVADGIAVLGKVRAYDGVGNVSEYSGAVQTIIDRTGPVLTITNPTAVVTTNAARFRYEWTAIDAGCGVKSYTVEFNGSKHQVDETTADNRYWYEAKLEEGDNTFKVFATDNLGNVGEVKTAAVVKHVKPQIILVQPMPGAEYKINEISTIAFQVIGLIDTAPVVLLNGVALEPWRIVTIMNTPAMAKFYVLLDGDVMDPGPMAIRITVGAESGLFSYSVDSERSGFGFGRLRPW